MKMLSQFDIGLLPLLNIFELRNIISKIIVHEDIPKCLIALKSYESIRFMLKNDPKDTKLLNLNQLLDRLLKFEAEIGFFDWILLKNYFANHKSRLTEKSLESFNNIYVSKFLNIPESKQLTEAEIQTIFDTSPISNNSEFKLKLTSLAEKFYSDLNHIDFFLLSHNIFVYRYLGIKLPIIMIYAVERADHPKLSIELLLSLVYTINSQNMITQRLAEIVANRLDQEILEDKKYLPIYIDFAYSLYERNSFPLIFNNLFVLSKILVQEIIDISQGHMLKLCVLYVPHSTVDMLSSMLLKKLNENKLNPDNYPLAQELLKQILTVYIERPIYNYQIQSGLKKISESIKQLAEHLAQILENYSDREILYQYYSSALNQKQPNLSLLTTEPNPEHVLAYSKLLWQ